MESAVSPFTGKNCLKVGKSNNAASYSYQFPTDTVSSLCVSLPLRLCVENNKEHKCLN